MTNNPGRKTAGPTWFTNQKTDFNGPPLTKPPATRPGAFACSGFLRLSMGLAAQVYQPFRKRDFSDIGQTTLDGFPALTPAARRSRLGSTAVGTNAYLFAIDHRTPHSY